jgi:flagellar biosynthesis protein FlhA
LHLERLLAVVDEDVLQRLGLHAEREPVYGLPAAWIAQADRERLTAAAALVFDPISVLGSHLAEVARTHAADLVGRQELQTLLEHLRASVPALVKEIGAETLPFGALHRAIGLLLREGAWPRDPVRVLEAMLEAGTRDPRELAEAARREIVPSLLRRRAIPQLDALIFEPEFEYRLAASWNGGGSDAEAPSTALALRERVAAYAAATPRDRAAVVCTASLRPLLADFLLRAGIRVSVFAYGELPSGMALNPIEAFAR